MSRSGYHYGIDNWDLIRWRGAVASAIRGKRGQAFLREMLSSLDGLPHPRLIAHELQDGPDVCAIGSVGLARGVNMDGLNVEDYDEISDQFGIAAALTREIEDVNDERSESWRHPGRHGETPEERFTRVRRWVESALTASARDE